MLLLSAAGIYALMSFTVSRRRKEIGIRAAMGADGRRLLLSVFSRAAGQLGGGVVAGIAIAIGLDVTSGGEALGAAGLTMVPVIAIAMVVVGCGRTRPGTARPARATHRSAAGAVAWTPVAARETDPRWPCSRSLCRPVW